MKQRNILGAIDEGRMDTEWERWKPSLELSMLTIHGNIVFCTEKKEGSVR